MVNLDALAADVKSRVPLAVVAMVCGVSTRTVRRWIDCGLLAAKRLKGGAYVVKPEEIERWLSTPDNAGRRRSQ